MLYFSMYCTICVITSTGTSAAHPKMYFFRIESRFWCWLVTLQLLGCSIVDFKTPPFPSLGHWASLEVKFIFIRFSSMKVVTVNIWDANILKMKQISILLKEVVEGNPNSGMCASCTDIFVIIPILSTQIWACIESQLSLQNHISKPSLLLYHYNMTLKGSTNSYRGNKAKEEM